MPAEMPDQQEMHDDMQQQQMEAQRMQHLKRRLRLFARVAGRVLLWRARAAERAYAPGGRGFNEAQANFQLHASSCV